MTGERRQHVANPPPKPLLIWDGECDFCRLWIERWREITAGKVEYATYQQAAHQFPEIPVEQFKRAMALIEPGGETFLPRKPSIARCDIDLREDGWRGATITFRDSRSFPKSLTNSSLVTAGSAQLLLDCYGEKTYGRQLTFGRGAGFCARSDSLI